jgi:hypothetical protein
MTTYHDICVSTDVLPIVSFRGWEFLDSALETAFAYESETVFFSQFLTSALRVHLYFEDYIAYK